MSNETGRVTRKLRAILSADVKGYSLLMADDEVHTIQTLKAYRSLMSDLIQQHSGRVVDNPGDNLLAEFGSAVDAVECAVQIQNRLKKENVRYVEDRRLQYRIGINVGDIVQDDDRIYGEGVNVAARIESIANAGGICISRNTYDQVKGKLDLGFEYLGEHEVKNIEEPVRVYKVVIDTDSPKPLVEEQLELPDKPSIAVLPFTNMSGDPSQEYFSDGLTEQIINGLCKVSNLFVIARNSSFAYKGKAVSVKQIAKELGVRYILEGSVQRAGERVRITAQLIDATTDYHIWSENYDRNLEDIFALQDEITMELISVMHVKLIYGEQAGLFVKGVTNIQLYDKVMKGYELFNRLTKDDNTQARLLFKQALKIDENDPYVYSFIGFTHLLDLVYGWSETPIESFAVAEKNAQHALSLNSSIDSPHLIMSFVWYFQKSYDNALKEAEQAVILNPNGADAHAILGFITAHAGNSAKGIAEIKKAMRLNPIPNHTYYFYLGTCQSRTEQYDEAIENLIRSIDLEPGDLMPYLPLIFCYVIQDQIEKAHTTAKRVLDIDPSFSLEYHKNTVPIKDEERLEKYINALRKAGLPN